jgi:hypothetical protein
LAGNEDALGHRERSEGGSGHGYRGFADGEKVDCAAVERERTTVDLQGSPSNPKGLLHEAFRVDRS